MNKPVQSEEEIMRVNTGRGIEEKALIIRLGDGKFDFAIDLGEGEVYLSTRTEVKSAMKNLRQTFARMRAEKRDGTSSFKLAQARYRLLKAALTEYVRNEVTTPLPSIRALRNSIAYHRAEMRKAQKLLEQTRQARNEVKLRAMINPSTLQKLSWKLDRELSGVFSIIAARPKAFHDLPRDIGNLPLRPTVLLSTRSDTLVIHSQSIGDLLEYIKETGLKYTSEELKKKAQNVSKTMASLQEAINAIGN
jgi:hypothetical protein